MHNVNVENPILVIGASGYLGQCITRLLGVRAIATHCSTPKFSTSLRYDLYADALLPATAERATTIIFAAAVEMNRPIDQLATAMKRLLQQITTKRFLYISSDAVFDGQRGHYSEADKPTPVNAYGQNLVLCETLIQTLMENHCIIRPSYIFGFNRGELDPRLARTRDALLADATYYAYNDYYKSPLSVHEVAAAVVQLADSTMCGPVHVAGPRLSAYEFHRRAMIALGVDTANLQPEAMPVRADLMRDTSLDSSNWWSICNTQPLSIERALEIERP